MIPSRTPYLWTLFFWLVGCFVAAVVVEASETEILSALVPTILAPHTAALIFAIGTVVTSALLANLVSPQWPISQTFRRSNLARLAITLTLLVLAWGPGLLFLTLTEPARSYDLPILVIALQILLVSPISSVVLFEIFERWPFAYAKMSGRYLYCFIVTSFLGPGLFVLVIFLPLLLSG